MPQPEAAPRRRHNSRPKFEVPVETGPGETPVGWVYRAEEHAERSDIPTGPLEMVGTGLLLVGAGTVGILSLAAFELIAAPIRLAGAIARRI